jgi:hypothetical protein
LAVVAYVFGAKFINPQPTSTPVAVVTPSPTPDPTANWKTYTNQKYFYSFKYPQSYTVGQNGVNSPTPEMVENVVAYELNSTSIDAPAMSVSVVQKGGTTLQANAQAHFDKISNYVVAPNPTLPTYKSNSVVAALSKSTFLNKNAYTYTITGSYYDDLAAEGISPPIDRKYVWIDDGAVYILIRADKDSQIDNAFSTFKLIEATPTATPIAGPSSSPSATPLNDGAG